MRPNFHLLVLAIAITLSSKAQFKSTGGPVDGGIYDALYGFGDTAFFELNNMPWRTLDGGENWEPCMGGLGDNPNPDAFTQRGNVMYMATNGYDRVYRSTDYGDTWESFYDNLPRTFGFPSMVPRLLLTSGNKVFLGGTNAGLWYTTDSDTGWAKITDIPGGYVYQMSVVGTDSIIVTQGGSGGGLSYFSNDNGVSWVQLDAEPNTAPFISASGYVYFKGRLVAITDAGGANSAFYSEDFGKTWQLSTDGPAIGKSILINKDEIYASNFKGIYQSGDGISWSLIENSSPAASRITAWKDGNEILVATAGYGLFSHTVPGLELTQMPIAAANPRALFSDGSSILCATDGTLYALENGVWSKRSKLDFLGNISPGGDPLVHDMINIDGTYYLSGKTGVFQSTDNGISFDSLPEFDGKYGAMVRKGANFDLVVLGERPNQFDPRFINGRVYYRNGGGTYVEATYSNGDRLGIRPTHFLEHNGKLFLSGGGTVVYVSEDRGQTWVEKSVGKAVSHMMVLDNKLMFYYYQYPSGRIGYTEDAFDSNETYDLSEIPVSNPSLNWHYFNGIFPIDGKLVLSLNDPELTDSENGVYILEEFDGSFIKMENSKLPASPNFLIGSISKLYAAVPNWSVWSNDESLTSIHDFTDQDNSVVVYPNPSDGVFLFLEFQENFQVHDVNGRLILQGRGTKVDLRTFKKGTYFLTTGVSTQRLIKY